MQNNSLACFRERLGEYVKSSGRHFEQLLQLQKMCSHFTVFVLVMNAISAKRFLITSKRQVATIKSSIVLYTHIHTTHRFNGCFSR